MPFAYWRCVHLPAGPGRARVARALRQGSMPFGAGPRSCPGRYLALLEMKMVLAMPARNFELVDIGTASGAEPTERMAFTMFPVGLRMRLAQRRPS